MTTESGRAQRHIAVAVAAAALAVLVAAAWLVSRDGDADPLRAPAGVLVVSAADLPAEARDMIALVDGGGPFPYRQDGQVFANREGLLPREPRGYYREYTVPTPVEADRGPRRLVAGRGGELYYTEDHYRSFAWVVRQ